MKNALCKNKLFKAVSAGLMGMAALAVEAAQAPSTEELWAVIQAQQKELEQLKAQQQSVQQEVSRVQETAEQAAPHGETMAAGSRTTVGGYGELHYNNWERDTGSDFNELDFHRFVLFFGHEFSDRTRFASEVEFEHAYTGQGNLAGDPKPGNVELEQAYIEHDIFDRHSLRAGLFLIPAGIINETHEPPTFYGVERNLVETRIIPTTWWEGGLGLVGELAPGWSYDFAATSGLKVPTTGSSAYRIREGRQSVANAEANNGALTGRIKWTGLPGVELAAVLQYQDDVTQGLGTAGTSSSATLFETHAAITRGPWGLRALYARWDLNGAAPAALGRDEQTGWYLEPSYKITPQLGIFARYSESDSAAGSAGPADTEIQEIDFGVNYWPHEDVVFKFDIQNQTGGSGDGFTSADGFNLGVGYQF